MLKLTAELMLTGTRLLSEIADTAGVQSLAFDLACGSSASQPTLTVVFDDSEALAATFGYDSAASFLADYADDLEPA